MSHKVTTLVYSRKAGSAARKAILAYMADRASDDGSGIWASKQTIADDLECGRSTVIRVCNEFVAEGILVETGKRKCANGATVEYGINLAAVAALESIAKRGKPSQSGTSPDMDPSQSGTPPVPERDPKASQSGTLTILEPSLNQEREKAAPKAKPSTRKHSIPSDAVISQKQIQIAADQGHDEQEAVAQFQRFKSSAIANGRQYANWDAAWRNWFDSPYFKPITGGKHDNRTRNAGASNGRQDRIDPAIAQIARLAGLKA